MGMMKTPEALGSAVDEGGRRRVDEANDGDEDGEQEHGEPQRLNGLVWSIGRPGMRGNQGGSVGNGEGKKGGSG